MDTRGCLVLLSLLPASRHLCWCLASWYLYFPCTAWPFPQGCLPALLPSSPQLSLVPLIYVILVLPFVLEAALCPARVLLFPFQCAVSRGASGFLLHKGELPFHSLAPCIHPLLHQSSLGACHTLHVSQLNECKLHQIV